MLLHGWPGWVVDFLDVIGPLIEPACSRRRPGRCVPPGRPVLARVRVLDTAGRARYGPARDGRRSSQLMSRLGYERYGVQGYDTGSWVAPAIGRQDPDRVIGIHVNALITFPIGADGEMDGLTEVEQRALAGDAELQRRLPAVQLQAAANGGVRAARLTGRPARLDRREVQGAH